MNPMQQTHAIVIGGSMAGMLAARVLADYYEQVTILDRDALPTEPGYRKGIPQSLHAHGLMARGQITIEKLFPGILQEMGEAGAWSEGPLLIVSPAGKLPIGGIRRPDASKPGEADKARGVSASRFLLEWTVRRRLQLLENVEIRSEVEVLNLVATTDHASVTGVQIRKRGQGNSAQKIEELNADLVVDASGRHSKVLDWLTALGYGTPPEEIIHSGLGYASRFYRKPKDFPADWSAIIINSRAPHNPRGGLILPIENDQWHVSVGGIAGHHPPTDEAGFMQWARELPDPSLYEAIRVAEPITPIRGYRTDVNTLRHFEKLKRWPTNFIVTGDAVCAFNPIYGQGMTTSALAARAIGKVLQERQENPSIDFERRVRKEIAKTVAAPWLLATDVDLRWEKVKLEGSYRLSTRLMHRYMDIYLKQATQDEQLAGLYFAVLNMLVPPKMLAHPMVAARVLGKALTSWGRNVPNDNELALTPQALANLRSRPAFGEV